MARFVDRRTVLAATATGITALAGCLGSRSREDDGGGSDPTTTAQPTTQTTTSQTPRSTGGGPPTTDASLPLPMEPSSLREKAISGGPPKDGIPSVDDPSFVTASNAPASLQPGDPVFGVATGGVAKAYPQSILVWHEICNDVLDGTPVSVTYCPLTGTAMGFERGETTFGVSGRLVNNNLIMYDRATETWWPQVLATAIPGPWNDDPPTRSLRGFRVVWTTWGRWRSEHPETRVLSRDTGYAKNYDRDPYGSYNPRGGYYRDETSPMFTPLSQDDRLPPKTVVVGARTPAGAVAVRKDHLRDAKLVDGDLGGTPVVVTYDMRLDTGHVYANPDGRRFEYRDGRVVDPSGETHRPDALPLDPVLTLDAMWFAWSGFYPDTTLYV